MKISNLIGPVDWTRPWPEIDEQFRTAYWRAHPIRPRTPGTEAAIPPAATAVHRLWTLAFQSHPGSPANTQP